MGKECPARAQAAAQEHGSATFITEQTVFAATQVERAITRFPPGTWLREGAEWLFRRVSGKPVELIPVARHVYEVMRGQPTEFFVRHAYFKSSMSKPNEAHPDRDNIGVIWFAPAVPMRGAEVLPILDGFRALYREYGFDFDGALLAQNSRTLIVLLCIFYSKANGEETERAKALEAAMKEAVFATGLQPDPDGRAVTDRVPPRLRTLSAPHKGRGGSEWHIRSRQEPHSHRLSAAGSRPTGFRIVTVRRT